MKTFYKTAAMVLCTALMICSCGNASAQKEKKVKGKAQTEKMVNALNTEEFNAKVYDIKADDLKYLGDKPAIVDFTATWCGPCQRIAPILEELAAEYKDKIVIYKVDVDENGELSKYFNISSIPAVMYIPMDGAAPEMTIGARGKEKFKEEIRTILKVE